MLTRAFPAVCLIVLGMLLLTGCDNYKQLQLNCQLGRQNVSVPADGKQASPQVLGDTIFRCRFRNLGNDAVSSCARLHVTTPDGGTRFVSETFCSGALLPDSDKDQVVNGLDQCPQEGYEQRGASEPYEVDARGCRRVSNATTPFSPRYPECLEANANGTVKGICDVSDERLFDANVRSQILKSCLLTSDNTPPAKAEDETEFKCSIEIEEVASGT